MKKTVITVLFGMFCGLLLCFNSKTAFSASAANDILVRVNPIETSAEAASYSDSMVTIQTGDYLVTVCLENNANGTEGLGASLGYNHTYFTPVGFGNGVDIYTWGTSSNTFNFPYRNFVYSPTQHLVGITCGSTNPLYGDKAFINFFLRPNSGTVPSSVNPVTGFNVNMFIDGTGEDAISQCTYSTTTFLKGYEYLVGDVDGSGSIALADPACLNDLVTDYGSVTENTSGVRAILYNEGFFGLFRDDGTFIFAVADVNSDGVIDSDDFDEVAYYYSLVLMNATSYYTGLVNTIQYYYVPVPF